jgi:hypothetical protein
LPTGFSPRKPIEENGRPSLNRTQAKSANRMNPKDEHLAVLGGRSGGGVGSHDGPGDHKAECVTADDERQRDDPRQPPGSWPCGFLLHLDEGRGANVHVERLP